MSLFINKLHLQPLRDMTLSPSTTSFKQDYYQTHLNETNGNDDPNNFLEQLI